jgi:uroporphyrinogen decarboxylase
MLAAINRHPLDRIPTDIWATGEAIAKIIRYFGEGVDWKEALHIDGMAWAEPEYAGPPVPPGWNLMTIWGITFKTVVHDGGAYEEQATIPLACAQSIDDLDNYRWPSADWFDYSKIREQAKALHSKQVVIGGYMAPFYFHNMLRGLEQSLIDPLAEPEFTHELMKRICDFFYDYHRRLFEAGAGLIDLAQVTDDLGSQTGPLISLGLYREFYKPHHKRFIRLCHEFGIKVFHHDDGSCRQFLPDLVDMGIGILNPVQRVCPGMELAGLKRDFGSRICFHGGIENQHILPFGTPEEVRAEVRHCIDNLASDGTGYILAPCHNIQVVTPIENILAMYDEAWNYGKRS